MVRHVIIHELFDIQLNSVGCYKRVILYALVYVLFVNLIDYVRPGKV